MGSEQFSTPVRGSGSEPINTGATGSLETNDYDNGDAFDFDGSAYPYTVNPPEVISELLITTAGDVVAEITTTGGDTFDLPLYGTVGTFDRWNIDSVTFKDPSGTTSRIAGGWAGE